MQTIERLELTRKDLTKNAKDTPLKDIGLCHFRDDVRRQILLANLIVFIDGDETRVLKNRFGTTN